MLEYKLKMKGIRFIKQEESYSSQCSPLSPEVSFVYAHKANRKQRGLYSSEGATYNADVVGAYNILRKYNIAAGKNIKLPVSGLSDPKVVKVAV